MIFIVLESINRKGCCISRLPHSFSNELTLVKTSRRGHRILDNQAWIYIIRDEERRLTAAPHANNEGLRSKDREAIATLPSGGRFFHCELLTNPAGVYYGS